MQVIQKSKYGKSTDSLIGKKVVSTKDIRYTKTLLVPACTVGVIVDFGAGSNSPIIKWTNVETSTSTPWRYLKSFS